MHHEENRITYKLPHKAHKPLDDPESGVYNLVLHGLLDLQMNEQCIATVEISTDFDAECLGLHIAPKMELL